MLWTRQILDSDKPDLILAKTPQRKRERVKHATLQIQAWLPDYLDLKTVGMVPPIEGSVNTEPDTLAERTAKITQMLPNLTSVTIHFALSPHLDTRSPVPPEWFDALVEVVVAAFKPLEQLQMTEIFVRRMLWIHHAKFQSYGRNTRKKLTTSAQGRLDARTQQVEFI